MWLLPAVVCRLWGENSRNWKAVGCTLCISIFQLALDLVFQFQVLSLKTNAFFFWRDGNSDIPRKKSSPEARLQYRWSLLLNGNHQSFLQHSLSFNICFSQDRSVLQLRWGFYLRNVKRKNKIKNKRKIILWPREENSYSDQSNSVGKIPV